MENWRKMKILELVSCACLEDHITLKFQKCGFFVCLIAFFVGAGLLFPYLTTIIRKIMPPFLPFISNAGGVPPSNGVFAVCIFIGAFFAFISFFIIYETINHRNVKNQNAIAKYNKIGWILASISCLGFVVVGCNPVGYTDLPNMFEWVTTVLFAHGIGATVVLAGIAIYQSVLGGIWCFLPDASKTEKYTRLAFVVIYFFLFLTIIYPLPAYILHELGPNPFDFSRFKTISYHLPTVYTTNFVICSVCEYAICILSIVYFSTFFKDLQRVSLRVVLRPKSCVAEEDPPVPSIQLQILA